MFEADDNDLSDLIDTQDAESSSSNAESNSKGNQSDAEEIKNEDNEITKGEAVRQKTIEVWQGKIDRGEATVNDIKPAQAWLKNHLKPKSAPQFDEKVLEAKAEEIVNKKMAEKMDADAFSKLKAEVKSMGLTKGQTEKLMAEYESLREDGVGRTKALEKAVKYVGAQKKSAEREAHFNDMRLPTPGYAKDGDDDTPFDTEGNYDSSKGDSSSRIKWLEKQRGSLNGNPTGQKAYQRFAKK